MLKDDCHTFDLVAGGGSIDDGWLCPVSRLELSRLLMMVDGVFVGLVGIILYSLFNAPIRREIPSHVKESHGTRVSRSFVRCCSQQSNKTLKSRRFFVERRGERGYDERDGRNNDDQKMSMPLQLIVDLTIRSTS